MPSRGDPPPCRCTSTSTQQQSAPPHHVPHHAARSGWRLEESVELAKATWGGEDCLVTELILGACGWSSNHGWISDSAAARDLLVRLLRLHCGPREEIDYLMRHTFPVPVHRHVLVASLLEAGGGQDHPTVIGCTR